jgi:hypothetical protein
LGSINFFCHTVLWVAVPLQAGAGGGGGGGARTRDVLQYTSMDGPLLSVILPMSASETLIKKEKRALGP